MKKILLVSLFMLLLAACSVTQSTPEMDKNQEKKPEVLNSSDEEINKGYLIVESGLVPDDGKTQIPGSVVTLKSVDGMDTKVFAQLQTNEYTVIKVRWFENRLFFINKNGLLSYHDRQTKSTEIVPIPEIEPGSYPHENGFSDFIITPDGVVYYLKGACTLEPMPCELRSFDLKSTEDKMIAQNVLLKWSTRLEGYDSSTNTFTFSSSYADAGARSISFFELSPDKSQQMREKEHYASFSCGEQNEYCSEQDLKNNEAFEKFANTRKMFECFGEKIQVLPSQAFVGCYSSVDSAT